MRSPTSSRHGRPMDAGLPSDLICFTGMTRGLTDLFVYELERSNLRRLTSDAFADIQPAWSPDGRRIAFRSDLLHRHDAWAHRSVRLRAGTLESPAVDIVCVRRHPAGMVARWTPDCLQI